MEYRSVIIAALLSLGMSGCYLPISGTVIDAETKRPVEGAVILVEWTKTKGIGLTNTVSYKVAEALSDKDGTFDLPGCYSPFVNAPYVTVYKKGYVAWSSRIIFPDWQNRTDFKWDDQTINLETFKKRYSFIDHTSFISSAILSSIGQKNIIKNAYYWEELEASKERDRRRADKPEMPHD